MVLLETEDLWEAALTTEDSGVIVGTLHGVIITQNLFQEPAQRSLSLPR